MIEVRIGVQRAPKELVLEIDEKPDKVIDKVNQAIATTDGLLWLPTPGGNKSASPPTKSHTSKLSPRATSGWVSQLLSSNSEPNAYHSFRGRPSGKFRVVTAFTPWIPLDRQPRRQPTRHSSLFHMGR